MRVLVLNGPNLNLLGQRQTDIYGADTLDDIMALVTTRADELGVDVSFVQSNGEGDIVDAIHANRDADGLILNAGAYTHTSIAIADAVLAVGIPAVEVHLTNVFAREQYRHHSYLSPVVWGQVSGFGYRSYLAALDLLYSRLREEEEAQYETQYQTQVVNPS